ncbi:MAG: hypothetical protein PF482_05745 [Desulfobacteraceae bacterium]|jgi:hypothetical protein|nr:hypothetical protein [Desulfobacteraceae bacterium]
MGEIKKKKKQDDTTDEIIVKRCPECFVSLPLDAKRCYSCHARIGRADKYGKARKSVNWISYIVCFISWAILFAYIKWAFMQ